MPKGNDFGEINPEETVTLTFDFASLVKAGVTISSPSMFCAVVSGTDANPSSRLLGAPSITSSPSTGAAAQAVLQQVSTMLGAVVYLVRAVVSTSDNQVVELYAHAPCQTPT